MPALPTPQGTSAHLPEIQTTNQALIAAFEAHPHFASQSAARAGKIYFMWDFAKRTDAMTTTPNVPTGSMTEAQREKLKSDAMGRYVILEMIMNDTTGMTTMMFQEQPGRGVELGELIRTAAKRLQDIIEGRD
ncbi:hypothetical protein CC78DRAFT_615157 [Lojkania enalia]|uniref:Uncharacterized protein n=1 Tax=Lojkania enalia TaxID=147567 RepID=A0A9P4KBR5_9PLEO|nr:hypothetical protein CC78DRAFT_615157 [Didymosphaeria enalia]